MGNGLAAYSDQLSGVGLSWLVQSTVLLALGLLAARALKRFGPAVQSGIYRTTLAAVLICPLATAALSAGGFGGLSLKLPRAARPFPPEPAPLPSVKDAAPPTLPSIAWRASERESPATERANDQAEFAPIASTTQSPSSSPHFAWSPTGMATIGLAVWLLGAAFLAARVWLAQLRMRRVRKSAIPAEPGADALCREIARQLNVLAPTVWRSPFVFSPCLDGVRRPAILLPDDIGTNLRETFVHELAHLARRDGVWNLLRRLATALLWLQPLVWLLSRRLEVAAEEVCDDYVVHFGAERAGYAGHLLELAERALPPPALVSVGMISLRSVLARRIVRILDTSRSLSITAGTQAVALMLAVGLALTIFAGLLGVGGKVAAEAHTSSEIDNPKPPPDGDTICGQVVGPGDKPVKGAIVTAWCVQVDESGVGHHASQRAVILKRQTTGSNGRYEFHFDTPELAAQARLIATAATFGLGFPGKDGQIRLAAGDLPIEGRLVDLEGRPVAGVKVSLGQVVLPRTEAAPKTQGEPLSKMPAPSGARRSSIDLGTTKGGLLLDADGVLPDAVVSDSDGRFRIAGLGRDVMANLTLSGPAIALKRVRVITRATNRTDTAVPELAYRGLDDPAIHGATCTIAVEPTRPIEGFVRDARTRQPIPGAVVTAAALSGSTLTIEGAISTETDAQGHYRLIGLPKEGAQGHKLSVYPPLDLPYFITSRMEAPAKPGLEPVQFDIDLKRGIWITGKVSDAATGKPVAAAVDYFPFLTNVHARDYPNFDPNIAVSLSINTRYRTDKEGGFRLVGLPGEGVVTAHTFDRSYLGGTGAESIKGRTEQNQLLTYDRIFPKVYQRLTHVHVPEGAQSFTCDMAVDAGISVSLRIVDETGAPVMNSVVWGRNPEGSDDGDHNVYNQSVIRIGGLEPGNPRTVLIQERQRKIGAVLSVAPNAKESSAEIVVKLLPMATLTGRLLDNDGQPAKGGVRVALTPEGARVFRHIPVAMAQIDTTGRFRCEDVPGGGPYQVVAANRLVYGFGPKMEPETFKRFELAKDLRLKPGQALDFGTIDVNTGKRVNDETGQKAAPRDVPVTGRIVNLEGQPIAGVRVKVQSVLIPKSDNLTPWLEGVKTGEPPWVAFQHIDQDRTAPDEATREATTDKNGRFRLYGFGAERVVKLELLGEAIAYTTIAVVTRTMDPMPAPGFANEFGPGAETIFGADFTYTAVPNRPIEGIVKDAQTGQALAGAEVRSYHFAGTNIIGIMTLRTKTDKEGRFRLSGMPKGNGNTIIVVPNDEQPYLMQDFEVPDPLGAEPVNLEAALKRGVWIEGTLTEKANGKPVPGARLHYFPFLENKFAQQYPAFDQNGNTSGDAFQDRYLTRSDGSFRLVGVPGRAIVGALVTDRSFLEGTGSETIKGMNERGQFETYNNPINPSNVFPTVMKEINPSADAPVVRVDLQVMKGLSVRLTLSDDGSQPITGVQTRGRTARSSLDRENTAGGQVEVTNLKPEEERTVMFLHQGRMLGKIVRVKPGDDAQGPLVVKLARLATIIGRVVDSEGHPVSGATVRSLVLPSGDFGLQLPETATDSDGRFRVRDVPTGCDYALAVQVGPTRPRGMGYHDKTAVKPGEITDVGEIKVKVD